MNPKFKIIALVITATLSAAEQNNQQVLTQILFEAVRRGDAPLLAQLFSSEVRIQPDINAQEAETGQTALMVALLREHHNTAQFLLGIPQINAALADHTGATALHYAARRNYQDLVTLMLYTLSASQRPQLGAQMTGGRTAADVAALVGHEQMAASLRTRGRRVRKLEPAFDAVPNETVLTPH